MTELELYEFIESSGSDTSYENGVALIWVYHFNINDFAKLIDDYWLEDGGLEVRLQDTYICIDMTDICEDYDIDMEAVFGKNN